MERIWLQHYPKDIPADINPDTYSSLLNVFDESTERYRALPAFFHMGRTITYQELRDYSERFASYLQHVLHLKQGDRIALMLPNSLPYPIALWGALRAGLTVVNVNPLYTVPEWVHQLNDCGAETILVSMPFIEVVQKGLSATAIKNVIVANMGDLLPPIKSCFINFYVRYFQRKKWNSALFKKINFQDVLRIGEKTPFTPVTCAGDDIAFLQYTGGTTGASKGAILTHRNIIANILQAEAWVGSKIRYGNDIMITALPLYHIFSLLANCLLVTRVGGLSVLISDPRRLSAVISTMRQFKFTLITGVNTLFSELLRHPSFMKCDFSALKIGLCGAMPVQKNVLTEWEKITGCALTEAYGLTEASPCVAINPLDGSHHPGSIGLPVPSTDVAILDDTGQSVNNGEPGELAVKGPQVMRGYWQNPLETKKATNEAGWLLTGDIAIMDENGFISIVDRKKDMVVVSGFKVYPNEIEEVLLQMPGILEAAIKAVPDTHTGEAVKAFVVTHRTDITEQAIRTFCHDRLTGYKRPKYIEFRSELPKSPVGKVLRRLLE